VKVFKREMFMREIKIGRREEAAKIVFGFISN
jgi:hypothetical protein